MKNDDSVIPTKGATRLRGGIPLRTMNIRLIRFRSVLLFSMLILFSFLPAFAETEDIDLAEELEEWVDLEEESRDILTATDVFYHTPNEQSPVKCDHETCFWKMEMGNLDGEAVWKVLTQPVTVLSGGQREQVRVLARPEEDCRDYVGVVTCASQAVHVLERGETWSLIEAYSSAEEGSAVKVFADAFQGYVKTSRLKEEEVDQTYGLVIDKLQQRLYVFKEGKLFATLLCSTGFAREDTPFHETPAGKDAFYRFDLVTMFDAIGATRKYNLINFIFGTLDFTGANYSWYIEMYIGLFLIAPFLNLAYNKLNSQKQKRILVITFVAISILPTLFNIFNFHII